MALAGRPRWAWSSFGRTENALSVILRLADDCRRPRRKAAGVVLDVAEPLT